MNFFSFSNIIIIAVNLPMAIILFISSKGKKENRLLAYLCLAAVIWGGCSFQYSSTNSKDHALFWWQLANVGSIFSTVIFYYFMLEYLKIKRSFLNCFVNLLTIFYLYLNFYRAKDFIGDLKFSFNQFYYPAWPINKPSLYLTYYVLFFILLLFYSFYLLIREYLKAKGVRYLQMKYLILGMVIGFIGCHACFFPIFNLNIYPYLNIFIAIYTIPIFYAIIRYHLMDIRLVVTRAGIFIIVYTLVLGIPLMLGYRFEMWRASLWIMLIFATIGPFIYLFLQRKAEDALLQEQRRYQSTLRQASAGMGKIKDLRKLLNLIVYIVTRAVRLEHALIYIYDQTKKQFILGAFKKRVGNGDFLKSIFPDSPLVNYFNKNYSPIVYDEFKQRAQDNGDIELIQVEKVVKDIQGSLVFPIFIDKDLIGIVILGRKESGKLFGDEDISVFSILANQAALAIENAQFYEDMKKTHEQLFQAEKMATIGTMADGLSHQINNRFHAMGFIAGDALDTIKLNKDKDMSPEMKEVITDLERAISRIQENVVQGGEVVQGLLRYTRKGDAGFEAIDFDKAFTSAFDMAQFKIKTHELKVVRLYDSAQIPKIKGNFTQLQEVFFNLIDNGYDAMMQRKSELKEPGFQPTLTITIITESPKIKIIFEDNGIGVKEEDNHKLFTPFFTTKLSSKKGTGLGLYVIKKIIEENHKGSVEMISEYKKGTQMVITLPLAIN